jgi:peptidoglycan/LPS O-acetylase OafA/YrhL
MEHKTTLGRGLSIWLDLLRLMAALTVIVYHASLPKNGGDWFSVGQIGGEAVILFFVLSGFVIAYVSDLKETTLREYAASRIARLWSILIPALAVTFLADRIGIYLDQSVYDNWNDWISPYASPVTLLPAAFFLNELWFLSISPLSNGPVWSLGFEFWYYAIFGAAFYLRGATGFFLALAGCLIAGPKILLMMPIWLFGVIAYHVVKRVDVSPTAAALMLLSGIAFAIVAKHFAIKEHLRDVEASLFGPHWNDLKYAKGFMWDTLFGAFVALHFIGFARFQTHAQQVLRHFEKAIQICAGFTLSLYLFHHPLMLMLSAAFNRLPHGPMRTVLTVTLTIAGCVMLGVVFEPQRFRIRRVLLSNFTRRETVQ